MEQNLQSPVPITPSPASQELPASPRLKKSLLPITLIILGVGLLGVGAYFIYQNLPEVKIARIIKNCLARGGSLGESYPPRCILASPTPPTDTTANWKTYTNNRYELSFKYPPNITFIENTAGHNQSVLELDWHQDSPYLELIFQLTPMTPKDLISLTIGATGNKEEKVTIGGIEGTKLSADGGIGGSVKQTAIYFTKNNLTYYFFTGGNPELTDQILSTFKLLASPSASAISCGGWNTGGSVECECAGKLIKPACPPNTICDAIDYRCEGQCGQCCWRGVAKNSQYPKCQN